MAADIVVDSASLPDAVVGKPYEAAVAFHGQASALTVLSASGLPSGLSLVNSGLAQVVSARITGTPAAPTPNVPTTYSVTFTLTDTAGTTNKSLNLTVHPEDFGDVERTGGEQLATRVARNPLGGG